jgi:hypothetical protein
MSIKFYDFNGGSEITPKSSINISWKEIGDEYEAGDIVSNYCEVENVSGVDINNFRLAVHPDISIWYYNNSNLPLADLPIQASINNLIQLGNTYNELLFTAKNKFIESLHNWRFSRTILNNQLYIDSIIDGLSIYVGDTTSIGDNIGFKLSDGHFNVSLAKDESGVPGTYYKTLDYALFSNAEKIKFWIKHTIPEDWDSHQNPMVSKIDAYSDLYVPINNSLRISLNNIFNVMWVPFHGVVIPFLYSDLPFEVGE